MHKIRFLAYAVGIICAILIAAAEYGLTQRIFWPFYHFPHGDAVGHFFLIGALSFVVNLAFSTSRLKTPPLLKSCLALALIFTLEEISQSVIPGRTFSLIDLSANYAGIFLLGETATYLKTRFWIDP